MVRKKTGARWRIWAQLEVLGGAGHHMKQGHWVAPERSWEFSCVAGAERVLRFQASEKSLQRSHVTNSARLLNK